MEGGDDERYDAPITWRDVAGHTQLTVMVCGSCGVMFAMPEALKREAQADRSRTWYCPNGHPRVFTGETPEQKAKRLRVAAEGRAAYDRARREQAEASARAQRAAATRARNERDKDRRRATHGVCPVPGCGRTFKQLGRHMAAKHPELVAEHECGS